MHIVCENEAAFLLAIASIVQKAITSQEGRWSCVGCRSCPPALAVIIGAREGL